MTKKNAAASVKQRLLNLSQKTGEDFQLLLSRYGVERLLFRLATSPHAKSFVLKGAMLFALWTGKLHRPTKDLDLLGFGGSDEERLQDVFQSLCIPTTPDDGLTFLKDSVTVEPIREEQEYGGKRIRMKARLGSVRVDLQIDVGFGDAITPEAEMVEFPSILGMELPALRAYPRETVVAEKTEAIVKLGIANSRMKDFHDLFILARTFAFDGATLCNAIQATFKRRQTAIPKEVPLGLTDDFAGADTKKSQWRAFRAKSGLEGTVGEFSEVVAELRNFLVPLLNAASKSERFLSSWEAGGPWKSIRD